MTEPHRYPETPGDSAARGWTEGNPGIGHTAAWDHDSGEYRIAKMRRQNHYCLFTSVMSWDFATLEDAMRYAEDAIARNVT